jgi:hypothetical protein
MMMMMIMVVMMILLLLQKIYKRSEASVKHIPVVDSRKCGPGLVWNNGTCIDVTQCMKPVLYNRECLNRCPDGYIYFLWDWDMTPDGSYTNSTFVYHYTAKDINTNPCYRRTAVIACSVCITMSTVLYCVLVWIFLCLPDCLTGDVSGRKL